MTGAPRVALVPSALPQTTVGGEVQLAGMGLFSGGASRIALRPAEADTGIVLRVGDVCIPAHARHLEAQGVHTTGVAVGRARFRALEHLLAALHLLGVHSCEVVGLEGWEVPDLAGGACEPFVAAIRAIGVVPLDAPGQRLRITESGTLAWDRSTASYEPSEGPHLELTVAIDFPPPIGQQTARWSSDPASVHHDVGSFERARSFLRQDLATVRSSGLDHWTEAGRSLPGLPRDLADFQHLAFRHGEWVLPPRHATEPAWHKVVDLAGDLLLLGHPLQGRVDVRLPGHAFNHRLVLHLLGLLDPGRPPTAALA